ncbi:MOSC domain-containing protein [Granulosicoccus antarcticus]|uniref:MOSC domain-containing protein n=1 Tax=Granulosicoccus antarcticus IMCC3135 TaxID=1192854 RepID=A0A2Z2NME5_9GAMM|nr:MOSC domain-containing protein [Granulosicoccus antarcticus]ASJ72622.1 hypothetical protein IMCC3135_12670 [Granulosicoccus antarcticus IMCC3135]
MRTLKELLNTLPQQGRVEWIGVRTVRRTPMTELNEVRACSASGLEGDRYAGRTGERHVTLLQAEHLPAIAGFLGRQEIAPELLRRNLIVSGINLLALKNRYCQIGEVILEITGACHPCSRMEELLGEGGYNAVRGHGGMTARVLQDGILRKGDTVIMLESHADASEP